MSHDNRYDYLWNYSEKALIVHLVKTQIEHGKALAEMAKALVRIEKNQTPVLDPEISKALDEQMVAVEAMKKAMEDIQSSGG